MNLDEDDEDDDDDEDEDDDEDDEDEDDDDDDDDNKVEDEDDDDIFYVFAARYHKQNELFGCIGRINWRKYRWRLIQAASKLPKEWFQPNNEHHEFIMWYDGTTFFNHHTTGIGLLFYIYIYIDVYFYV